MGSTPHSHATASTDHPAEQGFIAMIGVFISTFCICLSTVFINLMSSSYNPGIPAVEMEKFATLMTQKAFENNFATVGAAFLSISLSSFALTTIVGWYFFAESNVKFLLGEKPWIIGLSRVLALGFLVLGTLIPPDTMWLLADFFMGLMAIPNIIAMVALAGVSKKILDHYDRCKELKQMSWPTKEDL